MIGFGTIKAIGTVLTVASTASFGKDMYDKHKSKKKARQLDEVHSFIGALDLEALQSAIESKNEDALIDAVEDIIVAAEAVKVKSEFEELAEDAQDLAGSIFDKVASVASSVASKVSEKMDEVKDAVDDMEDDDLEEYDTPTYKAFKKERAPLTVYDDAGNDYTITVDSDNVSTNNKRKSVTFIVGAKEVIITELA